MALGHCRAVVFSALSCTHSFHGADAMRRSKDLPSFTPLVSHSEFPTPLVTLLPLALGPTKGRITVEDALGLLQLSDPDPTVHMRSLRKGICVRNVCELRGET